MESHRVNSIISGRSPPLHCTLTLITMLGHQNRSRLVITQFRTRFFVVQFFSVQGGNSTDIKIHSSEVKMYSADVKIQV